MDNETLNAMFITPVEIGLLYQYTAFYDRSGRAIMQVKLKFLHSPLRRLYHTNHPDLSVPHDASSLPLTFVRAFHRIVQSNQPHTNPSPGAVIEQLIVTT
jgi:hypothetical protein